MDINDKNQLNPSNVAEDPFEMKVDSPNESEVLEAEAATQAANQASTSVSPLGKADDENLPADIGTAVTGVKQLKISGGKVKLSGAKLRKLMREKAIAEGRPILTRSERKERGKLLREEREGKKQGGAARVRDFVSNRESNLAKSGESNASKDGATANILGGEGSTTLKPSKPLKTNGEKGKPNPTHLKPCRKDVAEAGSSGGTRITPAQKRPRREAMDTPSSTESKNQPKRVRPEGLSYGEAANPLRMAVVPRDYPKSHFTDEESNRVIASLSVEAMKASVTMDKPLAFQNAYGRKGVVYVTCVDEWSRNWLLQTVPGTKPWEGAWLKVGSAREIVKTTKVMLWTPQPFLMVEPETIVLMLKTQNPGLRTDEWSIIQQRPEPLGTTWIFEIDESSRRTLEKTNLKAGLGITSVSFRILGGQRAVSERPKTNSGKPPAQ